MNKIWVDGYNASEAAGFFHQIRKRKMSLGDSRRSIIKIIGNLKAGDVVVVFDGRKRKTYHRNGVKVIFTSQKEEADDFLVRNARKGDVVVTGDKKLKERLRKQRVLAVEPKFFREIKRTA